MGLEFLPLHWVWHDCWKWRETYPPPYPYYDSEGNVIPHWVEYVHPGHIHFFFNGKSFDTKSTSSQQAYFGQQEYSFSIEDVWGPNAPANAGRVYNVKLVGKPRWYFYIEEYWRRVYVQNWENIDNTRYVNHPYRSGIKYDACLNVHRNGPFREGGGLFFYCPRVNRGLPVEYWLDNKKKVRQCWVKHGELDDDGKELASENTTGGYVWNSNLSSEIIDWRAWLDYVPNRHTSYWDGYTKGFEKNDYAKTYSSANNLTRVFQYTYEPYINDAWRERFEGGEFGGYGTTYDWWPNPDPRKTGVDLRHDYLDYYYQWDNFVAYCNSKSMSTDSEDAFNSFLSTINTQLIMSFPFYTSFADYSNIWVELSEQEIYDRGLQGDIPISTGKNIPYDSNDDFGDGDDPFHKNGVEVNPYEVYKKYYNRREIFSIPRQSMARGDREGSTHPRSASFSEEDGARRSYPDSLYIHPVIEYQRVVQLGGNDNGNITYARLPEKEDAERYVNVYTDTSGTFGDGFDITIAIPYRKAGKIQSPFSGDDKKVFPPGNYFHDVVKSEDKLRYNTRLYETIDDIKIFQHHKYKEQIMKLEAEDGAPIAEDDDRIKQWFDTNWLGKPLCCNSAEEGKFYYGEDDWMTDGIWVEEMTTCLPDIEKFETVEENGVIRYGYYNSKGEFVAGGGKVVEFTVPPNLPIDGVWVEQCLGAIVRAKVELVFEDAFGHRRVEWVDTVQASSDSIFMGMPTDNQQENPE